MSDLPCVCFIASGQPDRIPPHKAKPGYFELFTRYLGEVRRESGVEPASHEEAAAAFDLLETAFPFPE